MDIPKQVKISGMLWHIIEDNDFLKEEGLYGQTRGKKEEIALETKDRSFQRIQETLLHELIHAIAIVHLTNDDTIHERQCYSISQGLFQVLRDNLAVTNFILGRTEVLDANPGNQDGHDRLTSEYTEVR